MSKHHQNSRRRAYGRRQHELRERTERHHLPERAELTRDETPETPSGDSFGFLDPLGSRMRFALGD